MASFSKLAVWPVGYFRAYSSWLLRHRKEIGARVDTLDAEIARIGFIRIRYRETVDENGDIKATEDRISFHATPGSSLSKLLQAYIAMGGNPLDISGFMYPDGTVIADNGVNRISEDYPHGGILAPMSEAPNEPLDTPTGYGPSAGGFIRSDGYYPARQGGRTSLGSFDFDSLVRSMHLMRSWANQDIKERLQDMEWRILKLCDLREQLILEREEVLVQAFGGALSGVGDQEESRFNPAMRVQSLVQDMYDLLYDTRSDGETHFTAKSEVAFLTFAFPDVPSEVTRDPLG